MTKIHIMSGIEHLEGETRYINYNNVTELLHEHQGSMDGACAIYSFIMALKLTKYVSNEDISPKNKIDRRSKKGQLLHELMESRGLVRNGTFFKELTKKAKSIYKDDIYIEHIPFKTNLSAIKQLENMINENWCGSTILGMDYKNGSGHAVLLVGAEFDSTGKISKILCLDPGCGESHIAQWNCYIDVRNRRGKFPFACYDDNGVSSDKCNINELIYIE